MKLYKPLVPEVYDELRMMQFELDELSLDELDQAVGRISSIKERVSNLIRASDDATLRSKPTEPL